MIFITMGLNFNLAAGLTELVHTHCIQKTLSQLILKHLYIENQFNTMTFLKYKIHQNIIIPFHLTPSIDLHSSPNISIKKVIL